MSLFRKFFRKSPRLPEAVPFDAPIEPSKLFYAIGDIHGCMEKLTLLLDRIEQQDEQPTIICVGDFIDRGEDSAPVLRHLKSLTDQLGDRFVCLIGNHENMCLQFLDEPEERGDRWLRYGGLQTLASFGIGRSPKDDLRQVRDALAKAMGDDLIDWMRNLPAYWITGNIAVTHAGADPNLPIGNQSGRNLMWGHPDFPHTPRADGMWVLHGHTVVDHPSAQDGRIAIDTGAYATGRLTAARVSRDGVTFLTV